MIDFVISCELAISKAPTASNRNTGRNPIFPFELNDPTCTDANMLPPTASSTAVQCKGLSASPNIAHASSATYIGEVCIAGITRDGSSRFNIQNMNISVNA
jgi:hypothetical protein